MERTFHFVVGEIAHETSNVFGRAGDLDCRARRVDWLRQRVAGGRSAHGANAHAAAAVEANPALEIIFAYGSEKEDWVNDVTTRFNADGNKTPSGRRIVVKTKALGSGECIDEIIAGRLQAHIASPASAAFIKLGNADARAKTGKELISSTENLLLSPVVIAMWKADGGGDWVGQKAGR